MAGLVTLAFPPSTIKNELGPYMSIAWAFMFIIGGVIGMLTIYTDRWKEERLGIKFIGLGLMVYTAVILTLHVTEPGSRLTQIGMIALAALLFVARYRQIKDWDIEPPKRLYQ